MVPQVLQAQLHDCKEAPFCVSEAPQCWDGVITCPGYTHYLLRRAAAPTFPALPLVSGLNPTMLTNSLQADSPDHEDTPSSAPQGGGNTCLPHKCNSYPDCWLWAREGEGEGFLHSTGNNVRGICRIITMFMSSINMLKLIISVLMLSCLQPELD